MKTNKFILKKKKRKFPFFTSLHHITSRSSLNPFPWTGASAPQLPAASYQRRARDLIAHDIFTLINSEMPLTPGLYKHIFFLTTTTQKNINN